MYAASIVKGGEDRTKLNDDPFRSNVNPVFIDDMAEWQRAHK